MTRAGGGRSGLSRGSGVRWTWAALLGAGVALLTYGLMYLTFTAYVASLDILVPGEPDAARLARLTSFVVVWGMPAVHLLLTFAAAYWLAYRTGGPTILQGALVGLAATVGNQLIGLAYGPLDPEELQAFLILGLCGGILGGIGGRISRAGQEAGQEALYRASREISAARGFRGIVAAIGEHLSGPDVNGVALWEAASGPEQGASAQRGHERLRLLAAWAPQGASAWPPATFLESERLPLLAELGARSHIVLKTGQLPEPERSSWRLEGIHATLFLSLAATGGARVGMLMVASRRERGFSRRAVRGYLTIGAQAALAVENVRLLEEIRRTSRQAGMLGERQRLAREIHDTLAQGFTSIVMNLEAAEGAQPPAPSTVRRHLDHARRTARESLSEARRLVWALRPESLENASLPDAISGLAGRWSEESGVLCAVTVTGTPRPLPTHTENALLRATQEALANVRKHARAERVVLTLSYMGDLVVLDARDDGVGFDAGIMARDLPGSDGEKAGGFGLKAMRERVEQAGGTLVVESSPGRGTALVVELPVAGEHQDSSPEAIEVL